MRHFPWAKRLQQHQSPATSTNAMFWILRNRRPLWVWNTPGIGFSPLGQIGVKFKGANRRTAAWRSRHARLAGAEVLKEAVSLAALFRWGRSCTPCTGAVPCWQIQSGKLNRGILTNTVMETLLILIMESMHSTQATLQATQRGAGGSGYMLNWPHRLVVTCRIGKTPCTCRAVMFVVLPRGADLQRSRLRY